MKLLAVLGSPISHSLSPRMHNAAIQALGLAGAYIRHEARPGEDLRGILSRLGLAGANITLPLKETALAAADAADEPAKLIGAANTLIHREGRILATNTDFAGFDLAASELTNDFAGVKSALILGAGGTARAVLYALHLRAGQGMKICVANRSPGRQAALRDLLDLAEAGFFSFDELPEPDFDLVINSTSAGLASQELPGPEAWLGRVLDRASFAFEVIYGRETPFLAMARARGARVGDGAGMLLWQGVLAFEEFWAEELAALPLAPEILRERIRVAMREALELG